MAGIFSMPNFFRPSGVGLNVKIGGPRRPVRAGGLHSGVGRRRRGQLRELPGPRSEEGSGCGRLREGLRSHGPLAYEAANIVLEAVKRVGKADRAAVRDAVRATKNYRRILGLPISFDEKGEVAGGANLALQEIGWVCDPSGLSSDPTKGGLERCATSSSTGRSWASHRRGL